MNTTKHYKTILLAGVGLLSLWAYSSIAEEVTYPTCAEMGYTTNVDDCISAGGMPLLCPYSNADNKACICQIRSCRGYPLFKEDEDYYYNTLDGGKVIAKPSEGKLEDYIEGELETCTTGYGNDAITYYRVPKCLDGYMFQNHICDKGCDLNQYPFTTHPGNLAGEVQICKDENGEHYGYTKCNDGWKQNGANCVLNSCDVKEFPYMNDPNEQEYRGEVQTCKIGGNAYYKYASCDAGFEPKMGVCISKCEITDCSYTTAPEGHKEWSCKLNNLNCRIGDTAVYEGIDVGTIFHLPDGEDNRVHMMSMGNSSTATKNLAWAKGTALTIDITTLVNFGHPNTVITDIDGKKNTRLILNFIDSKGWTMGGNDGYPAVEFCINYNVGCPDASVCALGEWYLLSEGELSYVYIDRYKLYNVSGNTNLYKNSFWSSTETQYNDAWAINFNTGERIRPLKSSDWYTVRPVLSFTAISE